MMISGTTPGVESVLMDGFRFNKKINQSVKINSPEKFYHCLRVLMPCLMQLL